MESTVTLESNIRTLMDASNDALAVIEADSGKFVAINDSHSRLFGYTLNQLNTKSLASFYNFASTKSTLKKLTTASNYEVFVCEVEDNSGVTVEVELTSSALEINENKYLLLVNRASSDKINPFISSSVLSIEQAFKDSEAKWQSITENSPDHIMLIDTQGKIIFINHTVADLTVDQVIGQSCYNFVKPDQVSILKENYEKVIHTGIPLQFEIDYRMDEKVIFLENRVGPVFRDGRVVALMIASRDITTRKRALQALEKSQQHLRYALIAGRTGTWEWDINTNEVTWSEGVETMFGMPKGSFQGSYDAYRSLIHPDDVENIEQAIENTLKNNSPYYVEHRCIFPDGSIHWVSGQGEVFRDETGNPTNMFGTVQDITERKSAEAELFESQQKLALHFQRTPLGVIDWNPNLEATEWNPAAETIFGFSREEAMGRSAFGLIIPEEIKSEIEIVWQSLISNTGGKRNTNENLTKDGKAIVCEWYNTPLVNDEGAVIGISSLVQDITERVTAERELEKHQKHLEELVEERTEEIREQAQIIDQIHDSVVSTDLDGLVNSWNQGAENMFGYAADEALHKNISFIYSEDQYESLSTGIFKPLNEKGEHETEVILQRKSGERFHAMMSLTVWKDSQGSAMGYIVYTMDITDRKRAEAQIFRQQKELEIANKELEAFSYSVSHDLRSPLRAIDGFSAAIYDDYYDQLNEEGKLNLQRIRRNAQHMAALIDDLLQLSRVTRHQFKKEPLSLSLLATDVAQKYKYENTDRNVELEIEDNLLVVGDPGLLRIALDNLISNAWKYTAKNESPKISLQQTKFNGNPAFCVIDNGVGFDMRYVDKLFGAFQRLHSSEEFSGNGIGLATVARIINRHGGKIWAEGGINQGAKFFFTLNEN